MPSPFRSAGFRWIVVAPAMLASFVASFLFVTFHLMRAAATPKRDKLVAELDATDPTWRTTALTAERNAKLPPPERNAAELAYQAREKLPKAYRDWDKKPDSGKWRSDLTNPHLPHKADVDDTRRHLLKARESLAIARDLRHVPGGGFAWEYREPDIIGTRLEKQQNLRQVMGLLNYDALVRAYDRDDTGAIDSCLALLAVARGIGDDPWTVTQFVRIAGVAITLNTAERVLCWGSGFDDAKLAEVDRAFAAEAGVPRLLYGLRGERAMFFRICENIDRGATDAEMASSTPPSAWSRLNSAPIRARVPHNQAVGLELYNRMIAAAQLSPGRDRRTALNAIEDDYFRLARSGRVFGPFHPLPLVSLLLPAAQKINEADTRTVASLNAARVAIACERHRQKTGAYPETLNELPKELLAEVPTDPFGDNPILYKKLADGAVAYSVGADGADDGAVKLNPKGEKGNDLGFRLWTPEHRRKPPLVKPVEPVALPGGPGGFAMPFEDTPKPGTPTAPPPLSPWVPRQPDEPPGR